MSVNKVILLGNVGQPPKVTLLTNQILNLLLREEREFSCHIRSEITAFTLRDGLTCHVQCGKIVLGRVVCIQKR